MNRANVVSDDWLKDIWGYVLNTKSVIEFNSYLPLLPVLAPIVKGIIHVYIYILIIILSNDTL